MFLMGSIFFGAFAAAIPVIIHLLHRQKSTPVQWGAMQFLQDTTIQQRRRRNVDHWLLLLLRMAAIILMALLLARPLLSDGGYNPFSSTVSSDICIVIDHSLSMGRRSGDRTLYDHGIDIVDRVIDTLHPTDTVSIVLAEHSPRAVTEHPISNAATNAGEQLTSLRRGLRQVHPGMTDCSIPDAVKMARDQVNAGRNWRKIILVLTDEQRSNWQAGIDSPWRNALGDRDHGPDKELAVYTIAVPPGGIVSNSPNLAISNLTLSPALIGINRVFTITAKVSNSGPGDLPSGAPIQLTVDGTIISTQQVRPLPAGESASLSFEHVVTDAGSHWLKVSSELVDGLDADNASYAAIQAIDRLPVLVIDGDLAGIEGFRASRFLSAALTPVEPGVGGALIDTHTVSPADAPRETLDRYAGVILNDVPRLSPDFLSQLTDYVHSGHGLWIILGPRSDPVYLADTFCKTPLLPLKIIAKQSLAGADIATIGVKEPDHPILSLITNTDRNAFAGTVVSTWWQVEPALAAQSSVTDLRTLLTVNHNDASSPLILMHDIGGSGGRVVVWTSNVDRTWNDLPVAKNFLPLVQETILHLSVGQDQGKGRRKEAGETFTWHAAATPPVTEIAITTPAGLIKKIQPQITNGKYNATFQDTTLPGLYTMRFLPDSYPQPVYFTVTIDKAELDPASLSDSDLQWLKTQKYINDRITLNDLPRTLGTANRGTELWPYIALIVLALLTLETYVSLRVARMQEGVAAA